VFNFPKCGRRRAYQSKVVNVHCEDEANILKDGKI